MAKFTVEIDPALLTRDGREYEPVGFRVPQRGDMFLSEKGNSLIECVDPVPGIGPRLILREKRWVPKEGEAVWIVLPSRNEHGDTFVPFKRTFTPEWGTELRQGLVFRDSATAKAAALAEALNSALKKAIGGGE